MTTLPSKPAFLTSPMIVAAAAIVALAGTARLLDRSPATAKAATARPNTTAGLRMGELVGRDARVVIVGTADGTRFDIHGLDGGIVAAGLTADEVAALLPGQDPRNATAQEPMASGPLMLADPDLSRRGIE